jgi:peptide/nickel transport system permease protein
LTIPSCSHSSSDASCPVLRRHAGRGAGRVHAVPICRRSGRHHVGQEASVADREALRERLGLNDPIVVQFGEFVWRALQGDFGISYRLQQPVSELILSRCRPRWNWRWFPAFSPLCWASALASTRRSTADGWLSNTIMTVSLIGVSLPTFLIGVLLIWLFAVELQWLPSFGRGDTVDIGGGAPDC